MNVLHIVAGLPVSGGGLAEAVVRLAREAVQLGHEATIATVAGPNEALAAAAEEARAAGVRIVRFAPAAPRAAFFSWDMLSGLRPLVQAADVVHVHSNWTFPVWHGSQTARAAGKPLVISPHGCLDPVRLAHSAWKKRLVGPMDRRCLRQADVIHATSAAEREWIARYLGGHPRIEVIPIGVDLPEAPPGPSAGPKPEGRTRRVLSLGRLHPLKGLDLLLDGWDRAIRALPPAARWELVIAGPDEQGTQGMLERRARELGLANVTFSGPLYGADKQRAFADAELFVLPSRSENFGIVVAEALAAGVPVITTKGTPWSEIEGSCGWWVDAEAEPLAHALSSAMRLSDAERAAMGAGGRELVAAKYQWPSVGRAMVEMYQRIIR
jgi:glycosyltransferase involved in cell wall biosynthesis